MTTLFCVRAWLCNYGNGVWRVPLPVLKNTQQSMQTSPIVCEKVKMTKMLDKMLRKSGKKKWQGLTMTMLGGDEVPGKRKTKITEGHRRRAAQVGVVLFDYITGLMNSGELHPQLVECAVEVSKVVVVPDFSGVNVHWLASGTEADLETQKLLDSNAIKLREMLIGLRPIGRIPKIQFVQDMSQARLNQLEELLKVADMGPEEVKISEEEGPAVTHSNSSDMSQVIGYSKSRLNADFKGMSHLSNTQGVWGFPGNTNLKASEETEEISDSDESSLHSRLSGTDEKSLVDQNSKLNQTMPYSLPASVEFRHDVYGLNRVDLVNKVLSLKRKAKDRGFNLQPTDMQDFPSPGNMPVPAASNKTFKIRNKSPKQSGDTIRDVVKNDEAWSKELSGIADKE